MWIDTPAPRMSIRPFSLPPETSSATSMSSSLAVDRQLHVGRHVERLVGLDEGPERVERGAGVGIGPGRGARGVAADGVAVLVAVAVGVAVDAAGADPPHAPAIRY